MDKTKNAARIQCTICLEDFQVGGGGRYVHGYYKLNVFNVFRLHQLWKVQVPVISFNF